MLEGSGEAPGHGSYIPADRKECETTLTPTRANRGPTERTNWVWARGCVRIHSQPFHTRQLPLASFGAQLNPLQANALPFTAICEHHSQLLVAIDLSSVHISVVYHYPHNSS